MNTGRNFVKKVRTMALVVLGSAGILVAGAQPSFANTNPAAVIKSVESDLVSTINAANKMSFASAAAKAAYLQKEIAALGKTEAGKYGSSLVGALVFAVLVAEAFAVTGANGAPCGCSSPSCS
jgi:hypothetical protein